MKKLILSLVALLFVVTMGNSEAAVGPRSDWFPLDKDETLFVDLNTIQQRVDNPMIYRVALKQLPIREGVTTPGRLKAYEYEVKIFEFDLANKYYAPREIRYVKDERFEEKVVEKFKLQGEEYGWKPVEEGKVTGFTAKKLLQIVEDNKEDIKDRSKYKPYSKKNKYF